MIMKSRKILNSVLLSVLVVAVLFVVACGSGDDTGDVFEVSSQVENQAGAGVELDAVAGDVFFDAGADMPLAAPFPPVARAAEAYALDEQMQVEMEIAVPEPLPGSADFDRPEVEPLDAPQAVPAVERMVIRNSDISVDTLYFEETVWELEGIVAAHGGFIESSAQRLAARRDFDEAFWYADFVIRVPVARFDETNREITALGQVTRFTTSSEDVTMLFQNLGSRLNIREEEERRVRMRLDNATSTEDIIALERELMELRLVIDGYRRHMTEIDQLASFSTIRVSLREVIELIEQEEEEEYDPYYGIDPYYDEPDTGFFARISGAFRSSVDFSLYVLELFVVFLAAVVIPVALLALPAYGLFLVSKKILRYIKANGLLQK